MILPAKVGPFTGEWRFLSNFFAAQVTFDGKNYASVEHAYQAAKTLDEGKREVFTFDFNPRLTAAQAKRMGRKIKPMRPDWEEVKHQVMYELLLQKFAIPELRTKLLSTMHAELVEFNHWHDTHWGVCTGNCDVPHEPFGDNWLGRLLMEVRNVAARQPEQQPSYSDVLRLAPSSPPSEPHEQ